MSYVRHSISEEVLDIIDRLESLLYDVIDEDQMTRLEEIISDLRYIYAFICTFN